MSDRADEIVGSVAEEAARFLRALGHGPGADGDDVAGPENVDGPSEAACDCRGGSRTCRACPVCRGVDTLRMVGPDALEGLADAVALVGVALRDVASHLRDTERDEPAHRPGTPEAVSEDIPIGDGDGDGDGPGGTS